MNKQHYLYNPCMHNYINIPKAAIPSWPPFIYNQQQHNLQYYHYFSVSFAHPSNLFLTNLTIQSMQTSPEKNPWHSVITCLLTSFLLWCGCMRLKAEYSFFMMSALYAGVSLGSRGCLRWGRSSNQPQSDSSSAILPWKAFSSDCSLASSLPSGPSFSLAMRMAILTPATTYLFRIYLVPALANRSARPSISFLQSLSAASLLRMAVILPSSWSWHLRQGKERTSPFEIFLYDLRNQLQGEARWTVYREQALGMLFLGMGGGQMGSKFVGGGLMGGNASFSFLVAATSYFFRLGTSLAERTSCVFGPPMSVLAILVVRLRVTLLATSQPVLAPLLRGEVLSFSILGMRSS